MHNIRETLPQHRKLWLPVRDVNQVINQLEGVIVHLVTERVPSSSSTTTTTCLWRWCLLSPNIFIIVPTTAHWLNADDNTSRTSNLLSLDEVGPFWGDSGLKSSRPVLSLCIHIHILQPLSPTSSNGGLNSDDAIGCCWVKAGHRL